MEAMLNNAPPHFVLIFVMELNCGGASFNTAELVEETLTSWGAARADFPDLGHRFSNREQQERESMLDDCLGRIERELSHMPRSSAQAERTVSRLTDVAVELAMCALGISDSYIDGLLRNSFSAVGADLSRWARQLDPRVSMADVLQACRNAWTAAALQLLFGLEVKLTPAIFAYSMLYPYSDNYLDDPDVTVETKLSFSNRFRKRLTGECPPARDAKEQTIWDLVGLIESQYPRRTHPAVYGSLLAIHGAQQDSLGQLRKNRFDVDLPVLSLSVRKGGTSVLADAYLAAGNLSRQEASFAFNWGVSLQLSDDLQDLREDSKAGFVTLFSTAATKGEPLDNITSRTFRFGEAVLASVDGLAGGSAILKQVLLSSFRSLLTRSAACASTHYTDSYLRKLEEYSPYRFAYLKSRERRAGKHRKSMLRLFELFVSRESMHETHAGFPIGDPHLGVVAR
jgi:hypothetical protein